MKAKFLLTVLWVSLFLTCKENGPFNGTVVFETIEIKKDGKEIDPDTTKAYEADIQYLIINGNTPNYLKDSVNKNTRIFLSNWFNVPETGSFDINKLIISDMREFYKQVDEINDTECHTCRVKNISIKSGHFYQTPAIISTSYDWYIYEGGSHGNYGKICYNYEKSTGKKITYKSLIKDETKLLEIALEVFKDQFGIDKNGELNDMFYFENNRFYLNDNFAFTEDELIFYYIPYEIAPYAAGLIELPLPYDKLKGTINYIN